MQNFRSLSNRLVNLLAGLDGDFWREMMTAVNPPKKLPPEQKMLDMVFRDAKAFSGYIPDMLAIMRRTAPSELEADEVMALRTLLGSIQLFTRILLMILLLPEYHDHDDLITTFNGYRQTLTFVEEYLASAPTL